MTILFSIESTMDFDFDYEEIARKTIDAVCEVEHFDFESEISITFTTKAAIMELNEKFRNTNRVTDVLSFPLISFHAPLEYDSYEFSDDDMNPETYEVMLGDIVLCMERLKEQALEYGHSDLREYAFLICHSMLHLLGYDHIQDDERQLMEEREKLIMDKLQIFRDLSL